MTATITQLAGDQRLSWETVTVGTSGSATDNDMGLNTIDTVIAIAKDTNQPANAPAYVTVNYDGTDGLVDIYCWDDAGAAATAGGTIEVWALGT